MRRVLHWRYLAPRLIVLALCVLVAQSVAGRTIRWWTIRAGERSVGAKVDVGDVRVSLVGRRVTLRDVAVTNPLSPKRNLVDAGRCEFELEPSAALHKRTIIRQGEIVGLRFGTPRETSGALGDVGAEAALPPGWLDDGSAAVVQEWLDKLHERFAGDLVNRLESVRLTEELLRRWPEQQSTIRQRVNELRERVAAFDRRVREAQTNPLRHVEFLEHLQDEVTTLRNEVTAVSGEVEKLPNAVDADRRAIVAARQQDETLLRKELALDTIDANLLTAYLLRDQLAEPVADLVSWLRWVRKLVPAETEKTAATDSRQGRDVFFPGCPRTPDLLVRSLNLQGTARLGGQSLELRGKLTDFSNRPALHDGPMRLRLTTAGSLPLELQATIDRTGPVAKDQLLVDCGGIVLPKLRLGNSKKLRLSLAPTTGSVNISVTLEGNRLSGDIQLVQKHVEIEPSVGELPAHERLDAALADSLGKVESLATRISLGGTLEEPSWKLWSNLGPAVAEAMNRALARTGTVQARQLLGQSHERVDGQLAQLDRHIADAEASLAPQLAGSAKTLDDLAAGPNQQGRLSTDELGRRLPANSLFR